MQWKAVKEATELHLARRGFRRLANFEPLVNLEVLWVNGNRLTEIAGLDGCARLRALFAHDNEIGTLRRGSLTRLRHLEELDLSNNRLRDLDRVLGVLMGLPRVRWLSLRGNPCCEEPDYRAVVLARLPGLDVLDQHLVTDDERARALREYGPPQATTRAAFGATLPRAREMAEGTLTTSTTGAATATRRQLRGATPRSALEQEFAERAEAIRTARRRAAEAAAAEAASVGAEPEERRVFPPAPPGWGAATARTFDANFRRVTLGTGGEEAGAGPRSVTGALAVEGAADADADAASNRFAAAGDSPPRTLPNDGDGPVVAARRARRAAAAKVRGARPYVPCDVYRLASSSRPPVTGLEMAKESHNVRFNATGLHFDRKRFDAFARRKRYEQPGEPVTTEVRV